MTKLKIDIVSDVACPWCPIGYKRLEAALHELAKEGLAFEVAWHPFELAPDMPPEGEEIVPHLVRKYGDDVANVIASQERIIAAARELGLDFDGALRRRAINTFDAHRMLAWAGEQGCQTEFALALFDAYFGKAENPADPAVLRRVAGNLSLDTDAVGAILASDRYADDVRKQERSARRTGIHAVPTFILGGKPLIQGAQTPATFVRVLREVASQVTAVT
ncbi:MAG: DsbA family oxidoreductase [Casimicrobiaceae bacterium]